MGLFDQILKKENKKKGGCCSFNLDEEIAKAGSKKTKKENSCCDFNLDEEINKAKDKKKNSCCG